MYALIALKFLTSETEEQTGSKKESYGNSGMLKCVCFGFIVSLLPTN